MYQVAKRLTMTIFIVAVAMIIILLSDYRPFTLNCSQTKADRLNDFLLALACGCVASCIFFWVQTFIPNYKKRKSDKEYIMSQINRISEILRKEVQSLFLFSIPDNTDPKIKEYVDKFISYEMFMSQKELKGMSRFEELKENDKEIKTITKELLRLYGSDLTYDQFKKLEYLNTNFDIKSPLLSEVEYVNSEVKTDEKFYKSQAVIIYKAYEIMRNKKFNVPHYSIEDEIDSEFKDSLQ